MALQWMRARHMHVQFDYAVLHIEAKMGLIKRAEIWPLL
jgi:hypothetical protein